MDQDSENEALIALASRYLAGEVEAEQFISEADTLGLGFSGSLYTDLLLLDGYWEVGEVLHFGGGTVELGGKFSATWTRLPYFRLDVERFFRPVPTCSGHWEEAYAELSLEVSPNFPNGKPIPKASELDQDAVSWAVRESQEWAKQACVEQRT